MSIRVSPGVVSKDDEIAVFISCRKFFFSGSKGVRRISRSIARMRTVLRARLRIWAEGRIVAVRVSRGERKVGAIVLPARGNFGWRWRCLFLLCLSER